MRLWIARHLRRVASAIEGPPDPARVAWYMAETWKIAEGVYQTFDVDRSENDRLDALATRRIARQSTAEKGSTCAN